MPLKKILKKKMEKVKISNNLNTRIKQIFKMKMIKKKNEKKIFF